MKYRKLFLASILLGLILYGCITVSVFVFSKSTTTAVWRPEEGIWYCEKLQLQISFEKEYESYVVYNEKNVLCVCENDRGSKEIIVLCQEAGIDGYKLGEAVFCGQYVEHDDVQYIVKEISTGELYTFIRTGP